MATVVGPPVLDRSLQMALMGFAQPIGQGLAMRGQQRMQQQAQQREQGLRQEDLAALIDYSRQQQVQQQHQQMTQGLPQAFPSPSGIPIGLMQPPTPQMPIFQSPEFQQMAGAGMMEQMFAPPAAPQAPPRQVIGGKLYERDMTTGQWTPVITPEAEPELLTEAERRELEMYGKRERPEEIKRRQLAFRKAQQDLKMAQHEYAIATSPEEKATRKIKYDQAKATLERTKADIKRLQKPRPLVNTPRYFVEEFGFNPKEAQAAAEVAKGLRPKTLDKMSSLEILRMAEVLQASASPEAFSVGQKIADIAAKKITKELEVEKSTIEGKSPYPEYPNAFLEDGVWKVIRNGKKYRIE